MKIKIIENYGISQAIDAQLDEDFRRLYGIQDVQLGNEWGSVFEIIRQDVQNVGKQYTGNDDNYKDNSNFRIKASQKFYEISQEAWNKIVNIAKIKMQVSEKPTEKPAETILEKTAEVVEEPQNVNEGTSEVVEAPQNVIKSGTSEIDLSILANKLSEQGVNISDLSEDEITQIINKYLTITEFNKENNITQTNDEIYNRLANYAIALKQYEAEKQFWNFYEQGLENETLCQSYREGKDKELKIENAAIAEAMANKDMTAYVNAFMNLGNGQVQLYDENGDNRVSFKEYVKFEQKDAYAELTDEDEAMLKNSFAMLNKNGDAYLDVLELATDQMVKRRILDKEDTNTSSDMTFREWYAAQMGLMGDEQYVESYQKNSDEFYNGLKSYNNQ